MTERRFDAIRLHGPGTDLTVGLFPSSVWHAADFTTVDGLRHFPNIPSEEMFTTPDPLRVDGHVTATRPLEVYGALMDGIRVEFEAGRAVKIDADRGADTLRSLAEKDDGASRLGELALVDGEGRIGPMQTVFYDTLLDENAASHIALGSGYDLGVDDDADRAHQQEPDPRRLHDRVAGAGRRRAYPGRPERAAAARGRLAGLAAPPAPASDEDRRPPRAPGYAAPARPRAAGRSPAERRAPCRATRPTTGDRAPERSAGAR